MINIKNHINSLVLFIGLMILIRLINPYSLKAQDRYLLTKADMIGFELKRQSRSNWIIGEEYDNHNAIRQKWHIVGKDEHQNIYIYYCEFDTEAEAFKGTAYAATRNNAEPFIWGSLDGSIIKDGSWVAISDGTIYFVRGNIGIKIFKPSFNENDRQILTLVLTKILNKIEPNLSLDILTLEKSNRLRQISAKDYQSMTKAIVNSLIMNGFSLYSTWDSKWLIDSENLAMGIRKEWKNEQGTIIGIDICKFASKSIASKAVEIRKRNNYIRFPDFENLTSLKSILSSWEKIHKNGLEKNLISIVRIKNNVTVHIYHFNPTGINTDFLYLILDKWIE